MLPSTSPETTDPPLTTVVPAAAGPISRLAVPVLRRDALHDGFLKTTTPGGAGKGAFPSNANANANAG